MKAIYQFLILAAICFINYFSFVTSRLLGMFIFGSEIIAVGFVMFKYSAKTSRVFIDFFSNYPFVHYVAKKQFVARTKFIKALGIVLVVLGLSVFYVISISLISF